MQFIQVVLTTLLSVFTLFCITRILGYRQLSELSLFDYVNGITIGSIAAELATAERGEILTILIAMVLYGVVTLLIAFVTDKSLTMRKVITGKPITLMKQGKLCYDGFKSARLDINKFLMKCRNNGYFDLTQVDTAVLEPNGRVSFIPTAANKPVTVSDIKVSTTQDTLVANVIIDGRIDSHTLGNIGKDKKWLISKLKDIGVDDISKVFLAICDSRGTVTVFEKTKGQPKNILE